MKLTGSHRKKITQNNLKDKVNFLILKFLFIYHKFKKNLRIKWNNLKKKHWMDVRIERKMPYPIGEVDS